ncbi:MAG: hypothetical protein CFE32_22980 [Alphaproteobacteria bacterium PA3]|nr:MAG: hypothetical protein CFE32_22980 [Alphaproteobacteria bacterium PA3]
MRKDQERAEGIAELQALITQGIESGAAQNFDKAAFLARMKQQHDGSKSSAFCKAHSTSGA